MTVALRHVGAVGGLPSVPPWPSLSGTPDAPIFLPCLPRFTGWGNTQETCVLNASLDSLHLYDICSLLTNTVSIEHFLYLSLRCPLPQRDLSPVWRSHMQFCSPKPGMGLLVPPLPRGGGQRGYGAGFCKGQSWAELLAANLQAGFSWASNLGRGDTAGEHQLRAQVSLFTLTSQMVNVALPTETCSDH